MRKKIILRLILFSVLALSIYSCMHDDLSNPQPEQQASASSFNVFRKDSTGKDPDYARGFAVLYGKYQNLHPDFKQSVAKNINDGKPAVFFRLASEVLVLDDGSKAVIYPVVTDDHITGLAAGVLNHEENYVSYRMVSETTENYENIISAFRIRFSLLPKNSTMKPGGNGSGCNDVSGCGETQIEPIVIRPKPRSIQWGGSGDNDPWGNDPDNPPGGECGGFGDCGGGGGNNNPSNPETPQDPCEKMKSQNSTQSFKDKVAELDKKEVFNKNEETGFAAAYGTKPYEPMANTANDNLKFPPGNKYFGYIHTHLDSKEGVIKIFSPADVTTFLTSCVGNAKEKGTITDAYGMVITSQGNYILKYSGDGNFAITNGQYESWQIWYNTEFAKIANEDGSILQNNVEKLFTQFLKEVVKVSGIEVYKSDKTTGSTTKLEYNGKDQPVKTTPCT